MTGFLCECKKTKFKLLSILLPVFCFIALFSLWNVSNSEKIVQENGYTYLVQLFLIMNCLFLPLTIAVMASRLMDLESKGNTWKLLFTLLPKSRLFQMKLLLASLHLVLFFTAQLAWARLLGLFAGIKESFPLRYYLTLFGIGLLTSILLMILQIFFSLKLQNQLYPLFIGLVGCFMGLFSMFLPIGNLFSYLCPWCYFTFGCPLTMLYDEASRTTSFLPLPFDWKGLAAITVFLAAAWAGVYHYFKRKDV